MATRRVYNPLTPPASDEADSISINFEDRERKWLTDYFPHKLDIVSCGIAISNRINDGDYEVIETGATLLDNFSMSGHPNTLNMSCISTPINSRFKTTENSKTYENATFMMICNDIASKNGLKLESNIDDFSISSIEQKKQTDATFITNLCKEYGYCIKIYVDKLIIYDREKYKSLPEVRTIKYKEIEDYDYSEDIQGSYDGGEYTYKDPITGAEIKAIYGNTSGRILKSSGNASSNIDAERKIKGQVLNANHNIKKLSITIMGEPIYSTQCVKIEGLGKIDGKYYINKVSHTISGGYKTALEMSKCE